MPAFCESRFAAWLQNRVSKRRYEVGLYREIAAKLPALERGRILDIGTGSGSQLRSLREQFPASELYGLDRSAETIRVAHKNLRNLACDLRVGDIVEAPYDDSFFDLVACNASMSYWSSPVDCFNEIYRILKPGGSAHLFEPQKDFELDAVLKTIDSNLADRTSLRRWMARGLNLFGLRWGSWLGLKLYRIEELEALGRSSQFGSQASVHCTVLQNLPIFVEIRMVKGMEN